MKQLSRIVGVAVMVMVGLSGCGGGGLPTAPGGGTPPSTTLPATTPPQPSPTPTPDPRLAKAPGPVVAYDIKVRSVGSRGNPSEREPFQRGGVWIVHPGEFVVFDSTPKNARGDDCQWIHDPSWSLQDPTDVLFVLGSSNPFLLRTDVTNVRGDMTLFATIDGVQSNVLRVRSE